MKKLFFFLIVSLPLIMGACSSDDDKDENDFIVPELTEGNSIQYTFVPGSKLETSIGAAGNKIAIDWGDGKVDKCLEMVNATNFTHKYDKAGTYQIKIWSEGLTSLSLFEWGGTSTKLGIGQSPNMTKLRIEDFNDLTSLKVSNCPNLTEFYIINCDNLTSLDLSECTSLDEVECNNNKLKTLNVSTCRSLTKLICSYNEITELDLRNNSNIRNLNCDRNKLTALDIRGLRSLQTLNCYDNELTDLYLADATLLRLLVCGVNKITALDVQHNKALINLMCANNELTSLTLAASTSILELYCGTNRLEASNLNTIFNALPVHKEEGNEEEHNHGSDYYRIQIKGNPGTDGCDTGIITDKGWTIIDEEVIP